MNQSDPYALPEDEIEKSFFTHKWKVVVAVGIFLIAIVYLGFNAFQGASSYYLTVGELVDKGPAIYDKNVRVNGSLIPASFKRQADATLLEFSLTDGESSIYAKYRGVVPDLFFNEHSEILLEGKYGSNGIFDTYAIIVKCPSKYQAEDSQDNST
jgi:cytochrome c-type biogenesis protein CcmE